MFYYYWSQKKNSSLDRGLRYRGSTLINFHISSIFVGIRIFQHLNLLLVHFDPISLMSSKPAQNAYLYKTALSPRLLHVGYVAFAMMQNSLFWWRFSIKSEDYSTNYGFLKRIISAACGECKGFELLKCLFLIIFYNGKNHQQEKPTEPNQGWASAMINIISTG